MARRKRKAAEPLATIWHGDDALWAEVEMVLNELDPPAHYGPARIDQRKAFDGVIYRIRSGVQWNHRPKEFGDDVSVHRTFRRWVKRGVLGRVWGKLVKDCEELRGVGWALQSADRALGKPMTEVVIANLRPTRSHRFTFLILRDDAEQFGFDRFLRSWAPGCEIRYIESVTEGAACTVLVARDVIDTDDALMIANCDQWLDIQIDDYLAAGDDSVVDGVIMTMWSNHPKWSYVRFAPDGRTITDVVEKKVISNEATVGIYNFRYGRDFVEAADQMIAEDSRIGGEFYVAPYKKLVAEGRQLRVLNVGRELCGMYGLGTPPDLHSFLSNSVSWRAAGHVS